MHVTRIEVFGFKSFMDRLVLPVEAGITGVVGPNGCGKSNIVDALRWVLGETRARSLRGGVLEDVIFNGTDNLRPLGLAEVSLTLRAAGDNFFADLVSPDLEAELVVERVIEEAEQLDTETLSETSQTNEASEANVAETEGDELEKEASEADAIVPEAVETEAQDQTRPHLTVISGNLDKKDSDAPEQNKEETNVIAQKAPAKNAPSATLLNRFSWLKSANEVQVTRRLYRSGESEYFINRVACRLKDIKEFFRAVGISARAYTLVAQGEVSRIVTSKPEQRRMILEEAAGVLGFRDKIASAGRRLDDTSINISRLEDIIKEVTRQVNSLRRQASRARNRQKLKDRVAELEKQLFRDVFINYNKQRNGLEQELQAVTNLEAEIDTRLQRAQAEEREARSELMSVDVEGDQLRNKIDAIKEEIGNRSQQRAERNSRVKELNAFALSRATEIKRLGERKQTLMQRKEEGAVERERFLTQDDSLSQEISALSSQDEVALKEAAASLASTREDLKTKERDLRSLRDRLVRSEGELDAIKKQLVAASPVNQLKNSLGDSASASLAALVADTELFIDSLTVPTELVQAVQAVLAERAGFLISDKPYDVARQFISEIQEDSNEDTRGFGLGVFQKEAHEVEGGLSESKLPFPKLLSKISIDRNSQGVASRVFHNVYLVDAVEAGAAYFESHPNLQGVVFVTPQGDLVTDYSFYSLRHEGGFLHLKSKAEELTELCVEFEQRQVKIDVEKKALQDSVQVAEQRHKDALAESRSRQAQVRELSKEQGSIRGRLQAEQRAMERVVQDLEKVVQQVREADVQILEYDAERERVEQEIAALVPEVESKMHEELRGLNAQYLELDGARSVGRETLATLARQVEIVRRELDDARAKNSNITLELQKATLEIEHLQEKVLEEYGEEIWQVCADASHEEGRLEEEDKDLSRAEVLKLKARIAREGDVDPSSIEHFEEEKARLDDLTTQKEDLKHAAATLRRTIERLRETSEKKFLATLERVKDNFSQLAPRLFGGGRASLELLDPQNPLDSGIAIIARPPGKRLKSIDLLSGGEKALCAIALIFSMFMVRPSPLCVLDEVDAPLDDANLVRFLSLIKEMSASTQFLMITHNKASMSVADNLVGVTMEEPGASKVLTVSLQEAYEQVA
ncbi:hypothetical protein OAO01_00465 [Oligoflexia bacterium]|nr:hypothetical protein [Oligoflexia bacterium]